MEGWINPYYLDIIVFLFINIILGLGLNLITGYAGQVSLGHAAFYGIGAYSTAIFSVKIGLNPWLSILLAVIITFLLSAILGLPSLRVREDFLAITTLGLGLIAQSFFKNAKITGGAYGIDGIPMPSIFGHELTDVEYLLLVFIVLLVLIYVLHRLSRSKLGQAWTAIQEDEVVAQSMGINTLYYKVLAFAIGGAFAGVAGALFAHKVSFISSDTFGFTLSATLLSMVVIGGLGTIRGTLFGVSVLYLLPEVFRIFDIKIIDPNYIDTYKMILYGLLMVIMMRYRPKGVFGRKIRHQKRAVKD
ncbi:amino acid/amide ABC transporter membrane protein 2, HAAT family [Seinonella peptonophila]|uniref:Amino acid/amide ABC transporter membrane protein 2, HAAT family n=1 Tax=Seinonella peptonophila TaxID=112248 RepID=A0A1M4W8J5_9BACL|nr:branched-chain amino acid ABC transporter permease [Seinonella peptonophila]SHE77578.1 amino acid/amide ABC transporter membrane protein 2, HAAT family [Seinonella peptonophila]